MRVSVGRSPGPTSFIQGGLASDVIAHAARADPKPEAW